MHVKYYDNLYDIEWELPEIIEKIVHTKEMIRLRNIVQGVIPNDLNPMGPLPSRFQHGMGVCYLAQEVLKQNPNVSKDSGMLLPVCALLHDAGNPPFSHLSEPFLKEVTGHDGESFLAQILDGSETEKTLKEYGIHAGTVVKMVTGKWKPFSDVLNGSMDIDNLDNVARYAKATNLFTSDHLDSAEMACSFRFDKEWYLLDVASNSFSGMHAWKNLRWRVYNQIYSAPHLNMAMMLQRAVQFAYDEGELKSDFFLLDDYSAMLYLKLCNERTATLIRRLLRWECYDEVVSLEYENSWEKIRDLSRGWIGRKTVADVLSKKLNIPKEDICVVISKGRDRRKVTLPLVSAGKMRFDEQLDTQVYRVKVYMRPELQISRELVKDLILQEVS